MSDTQQQQAPIDDKLRALIGEYLGYERNVENRNYIESLIKQNNIVELERLIGRRLTFGTAGIRGRMGPGFGQMNDLVIIQTSQGLVSYLLESEPLEVKEKGVIIGHDARHNSDRFARLAALAFLQKGIPVYYCDHIIPTPLIAFGVRHYGCLAGIVVTASHNPKDDNGYKVYGPNGAQILSPHDKRIQEHIMLASNQRPWQFAWRHELLLLAGQFSPASAEQAAPAAALTQTTTSTKVAAQQKDSAPKDWEELVVRVERELSKNYFAYLEKFVGGDRRREHNGRANVSITYTSMHGVGHTFVTRALDIAGFEDIFPVELQKKPDPQFSTVKFPNPEEAGALDLAFETAKHANSNLILAVDPDADRCAAALYEPNTDYKRLFTGNELGALLGWWIWHTYVNDIDSELNAADPSYSDTTTAAGGSTTAAGAIAELGSIKHARADCYMISTAVSSKFLQSMARIEGFQFVETLTGFKYMGNLADELATQHNKRVLFAYEEAIGYMVDSTILDKDGISAAIQVAQCSAYVLTTYHRTLEQQLDWLYTVYGYHYNLNSYYVCSNPSTISEIFQRLQANYPTRFSATDDSGSGVAQIEFQVNRVRDLNNGYDSATPDKRATLPTSSSSFMVTFFVDDDITFTIRTSGTEPKIKYYSEIVSKLEPANRPTSPSKSGEDPHGAAKERIRARLRQFLQLAIEDCLQPARYELEPAD